eukprot:4680367-Prymnesium_polylepis.1
MCIWRQLSTSDAACKFTGWYLDPDSEKAGFKLKKYKMTLADRIHSNDSKDMAFEKRFEWTLGVVDAVYAIKETFPGLLFHDIKPDNFMFDMRWR